MNERTLQMLRKALIQWRSDCPGAGWEHHQLHALVTLAATPSMRELLDLAALGMAIRQSIDDEASHSHRAEEGDE